jgi:glucose/arabinose dehydrogenase
LSGPAAEGYPEIVAAGPGRELSRASVSTAFALALVCVLCGVLAAGGARAQGGGLELRQIGDFDMPVHVAEAPGSRKLLFVVEQAGVVRAERDGRPLGKPFLDLRSRVRSSYEEGLLSIAFDPDYRRSRRFFLYYVGTDGDLHIDSFKRKRKQRTRASLGSRRKLLEIPHPQNANHNGGQLQFGPDGFLYIGTGDGGGAGDPGENAQDPESLLGKLLRVDPRRKRGYDVPASNPFAGGPGADEVYALGLRNPWRFTFDRENGDLTIGDVGQSSWEELDHLPLDAARGANFGWDNLEGNHPFEDPGTPPAGYVPPIHEYKGGSSVIAGYVVRDPRLPSLAGRLLYTDLSADEIRSLDPNAANPSATDAPTGLRASSIVSFGEGAGGKLYASSIDGPVYRIVER